MSDTVIKKIVRDVVHEEIKPLENGLSTLSVQVNSIENKIDKKFDLFLDKLEKYFFDFRSDMAKVQDTIAGELKTNRDEQVILNGRSAKINQIEDDVEKLQKIHPNYTHTTL